MDQSCEFICLNKKYGLVLCLECDYYISRVTGDTWQDYHRKICRHLNKHTKASAKDALTEAERLRIFSFLELNVGTSLAVTRPNNLVLHSRDSLLNVRQALYMKQSRIVSAVLCGVDGCDFVVADEKNRMNRLKAHNKTKHNGMEIQQIPVKVQEFRLNNYLLLGPIDAMINLQAVDDEIVFMPKKVCDQPATSKDADQYLPMLELLEDARKQTEGNYVGKWEKFFRLKVSESLVMELFTQDTSGVSRDSLLPFVDAWLAHCEQIWSEKIEPNYSLQQLLMKHFEEANFVQKSFRYQAVQRKGRYLLVGFLGFCMSWRMAKSNGRIPPMWNDLLSSTSQSYLEILVSELETSSFNFESVHQFLNSIFETKVHLQDANVLNNIVSVYLIGWIYREGLEHAPKHLRNASQGAYAFENLIRLHSAVCYVHSGEASALDRVRLQVVNAEGIFVNVMEFAHQVCT